VLLEEYLIPMRISQTALAKALGVTIQRVNEIVKGKRGITPETAWMFAEAFGTSPEMSMTLQIAYDLAKSKPAKLPKKLRSNRGPDVAR
jgi:addiction module HigA family antidote